ncbi:MAG: hypothetical protein OWV35_01590 [Firmicutes bacterium]|nr:hypothetical protein [Bacillota bacterium]
MKTLLSSFRKSPALRFEAAFAACAVASTAGAAWAHWAFPADIMALGWLGLTLLAWVGVLRGR